MGRCSRSLAVLKSRVRISCCGKASFGACIETTPTTSRTAKSSSDCFECVETTLHDSAQESQSRGSGDSVLLEHPSPSHGQPLGYSAGASREPSCAGIPNAQHSTSTPARQSVGMPTRLQTTAASARTRMNTSLCHASTCVNEIRHDAESDRIRGCYFLWHGLVSPERISKCNRGLPFSGRYDVRERFRWQQRPLNGMPLPVRKP